MVCGAVTVWRRWCSKKCTHPVHCSSISIAVLTKRNKTSLVLSNNRPLYQKLKCTLSLLLLQELLSRCLSLAAFFRSTFQAHSSTVLALHSSLNSLPEVAFLKVMVWNYTAPPYPQPRQQFSQTLGCLTLQPQLIHCLSLFPAPHNTWLAVLLLHQMKRFNAQARTLRLSLSAQQ